MSHPPLALISPPEWEEIRMRRAPLWLVSTAAALMALGASAPTAAAYYGHAWSNSDAFTATCIGVRDTYPSKMYSLAVTQFKKLGFVVSGALGPGFTRTAFLGNVMTDSAVYVHSHGDNYWASGGAPNIDSGFMQDPGSGKCNTTKDIVRSSAIKTATAGTHYNIVIMSTCFLGSSNSTMPSAFQIEKVKSTNQAEFYLGNVGHAWDSAQYRFESLFWSYMNSGVPHTRWLSEAFTYAVGVGGYEPVGSEAFKANWWGNPKYDGTPGLTTTGCPSCDF
jgi:hypothetical protein